MVHRDVEQRWLDLQSTHYVAIGKFLALASALSSGQQTEIVQLLARNDVQSIHDSPGLVELGPKQNKGGAPRSFLYRGGWIDAFVAAGLEKGNHGVREIAIAKTRAQNLRDVTRPQTATAAEAVLSNEYRVIGIRK